MRLTCCGVEELQLYASCVHVEPTGKNLLHVSTSILI